MYDGPFDGTFLVSKKGLLAVMVVFGKSSRSKYPRIEWLRTESNGLLHPPVNQEVPSIARETSSDSIDFNDIPESGPESETEAVCANCVAQDLGAKDFRAGYQARVRTESKST